MPGDWQSCTLGDLAVIYDGPHATPAKTVDGPWYLSISSLVNGRFSFSQSAHLSFEDLPRWTKRVSPMPGDTLFSYETRLGDAAHWIYEIPAAIGRRMGILRPKRGVDPRYLTYMYLGPVFQEQIRLRTIHGATVDRLPISEMPKWGVEVAPLEEQRRIAGVLGALDDLIDTNESINQLQMALVHAEFLRRFGTRPTGVALSELATIKDCLHSKKPERLDEGKLILQLNNISDDGVLRLDERYLVSESDYGRWAKNFETEAWDCVITNVGRVGAVSRIPAGVHAALGRNMTGIRPTLPLRDGPFVAIALTSPPMRREIEKRTDTGTILDALNVKNIPLLRMPQSSDAERTAFSEFAGPVLENIDALIRENGDLRSTRDELLPLLMSGKIRVRETETL